MTREERDKAIRILQWLHDNNFLFRSTEEDVKFATEYAIKALEQESFINKPCVSSGVCEHDKNKVLDKIKVEIEGYKSTIDNAISEDELKIEGMKEAYTDCLNIIDKYKAESEE